jgi:hypothetical protein
MTQSVLIVVRNVKFLLSLQKANQLDVRIALRRIDPQDLAETDSVETIDLAEETEDLIADLEKCIKQLVLTVIRNVKFLLSQQKANQLDVKSVL